MQRDWESLIAGVMQLHEHLGAICMNTIHHTGKTGDHVHIRCAQLTRLCNAGQFIHTATSVMIRPTPPFARSS